MNLTCFRHSDRNAVARIERPHMQQTTNGVEEVMLKSPVCQDCVDKAWNMGTPILPLSDN
jgi:hypothetical protein